MSVKPKWTRPSGPLNVWKVVDGYETLNDGTKKPVKFSIQDVPNDEKRRQEVLQLMYTHFLAEEPCSKSLKIKDTDPDGVQDFLTLWKYSLDQGVVIACYKLDSNGKIENLVGANIIFMKTPETLQDFNQMKQFFKSSNFLTIWDTFEDLASRADVCKTYNVDRYITSISLSILPAFRGQKLGLHILDARSPMAKKYGFSATTTFFTAQASQIQAKRAGFEEGVSVEFADILDDKGNPKFPNIDSKYAKIMMKRLP
ncbi:uncharacterized protein LOC131670125 [Phymastichus coffea]|uniref:uncharacterized protein LOC131670125 n=1 Tax=Phymastichus coffea TaxID=108790 RepID=UPI00273ADBA0|nr:uncharacterized protein LOC131670125 [Phymastichus coffea]